MESRERVFAAKLASGQTIKQSMVEAGYPLSRAKRGIAGMSKKMLKALSAEGYDLAQYGKSLSLDTLKNMVIGRLATNVVNGKDGGVMSAKTLGSHRELNLFVPESQVGVIVLGMPGQIEAKREKLLEGASSEVKE
jgi:hypothetical protein